MKILQLTLITHHPEAATGEFAALHGDPVFPADVTDLDDFITRSSALVGSPTDRVGRYHDRLATRGPAQDVPVRPLGSVAAPDAVG